MMIAASVVGVMILFVCVTIGILIATGVIVYRDAQAHGMKAIWWTLLAVFAPNFIGIIIYLIVRHGVEKQCTCSNCGIQVKEDYNICPNCHSVFEKMCHACNHAIKKDMAYCPYCGEAVGTGDAMTTATKVVKKTNIIKPFAWIVGIYVVTFIIVMGTMLAVGLVGEGQFGSSGVSVVEMSNHTTSYMSGTFRYKIGNETMTLKLEPEEVQRILLAIELTQGTITLEIKDPSGNIILEQLYEEGIYTEEHVIVAKEAGKYKVNLYFKAASGAYSLNKQ